MQNHPQEREFDAIVAGGSYVGQSAALQLARASRSVLVIDAGRRRNRYAHHSHGFLTQDGTEASAVAAEGRRQLLKYPNATWVEGTVSRAEAQGDGFAVTLADGVAFAASRLIPASVCWTSCRPSRAWPNVGAGAPSTADIAMATSAMPAASAYWRPDRCRCTTR